MFQAKVTTAAKKLGNLLRLSDELELGKIRLKLLNAGFRQEQAVAVYFGAKVIGLLIVLGAAFPLLYMNYGMTQTTLGAVRRGPRAPGFLPPRFHRGLSEEEAGRVDFWACQRPGSHGRLRGGGVGLDAAMRRVTSELGPSTPVLCEEFAIANFQLQMGPTRSEVLRDLGIRSGVDDVRALAGVIIQAESSARDLGRAARAIGCDASATTSTG